MSRNKKEVLISIRTDLETSSVQAAAKKLQGIISKTGVSQDVMKNVNTYVDAMEKAAKDMDALAAKGQINTQDYKNLNGYFKLLKDNYNKVADVAKKAMLVEPDSLKSLREKINIKESGANQRIRDIKTTNFRAKSKVETDRSFTFDEAKNAVRELELLVDGYANKKDQILKQTNDAAEKSINDVLAAEKKANGQKFKSLDDYKNYYENKQKEIAKLAKNLTKKNLTDDERKIKDNELANLTEEQKARSLVIQKLTAVENENTKAMEIANEVIKKDAIELDKAEKRKNALTILIDESTKEIQQETNAVELATQADKDSLKVQQDLYDLGRKDLEQEKPQGMQEGQTACGKLDDNLKLTGDELARIKGVQDTVGRGFDDITNRLKGFISAGYLISQVSNKIRDAARIVSGLDNEITEIAVVTKQFTSDVWDSFDTFNKAAMDLSTTTKQYLEGAKIFYQQGLNTAQVMQMVEATTKAAALSGVDFRAASETLTAAINAYSMEATQAMAVTDKFAAVGAASAADFKELSTAMEKVASQAYSSGMSFDSLLGILGKGLETTREAPEAIGTALKTIIARFQEMKENPMAQLEDGTDANRVETALKTIGVSLRDTSGEFRNMDDVFADLGESWKGLTRNQKAYIATMAAGSRQQSRFMAIMNDYDRTLQLIRTSTNSAGEANAQYAIYEDSVAAAHQKMQNSFEQMSTSFMSADLIKGFYNLSATFLAGTSKMNPAALAMAASVAILIGKILTLIATQKIKLAGDAIESIALPDLVKKIYAKVIATNAQADATAKATAMQWSLNAAVAIWVVGAIAAVAAVVTIIYFINKWSNAVHELAAEKQKLADQEKTEYQNLKAQVGRYEELSKVINKTKEEEAEYNEIIKSIATEMPELIDGIDKEGNAILVRNEALEEEIRLRQSAAKEAEIQAYHAKIASMSSSKWNATLEKGAAGQGTVDASKRLQEFANKVSEENPEDGGMIMGTFQGIGGITSNLDIWDKVDKEAFIRDQARKRGFEEGTKEYQYYANAIKKIMDEADKYLKVRMAETRKVLATGLYNIGSSYLESFELQNETFSNEFKDLVAGMSTPIAESLLSMTSEQLDTEASSAGIIIDSNWKKLDDLEKQQQIAEKIQIDLIDNLRDLSSQKGFDEALSNLFESKESGKSLNEMEAEFNNFADKFNIPPELKDKISKSFFNEDAFQKQMNAVSKHLPKLAKNLEGDAGELQLVDDEGLQKNIEETFRKLPQKLSENLANAIQTMDESPAKDAFIRAIPEIFADDEFTKVFGEQLANTDIADPAQLAALEEKFSAQLEKVRPDFSVEEIKNATAALIEQSTKQVGTFLEVAKTAYDEFTKLNELAKKSASGMMTLGDALEQAKGNAESVVTYGDGRFGVSGGFIENQRRAEEIKMVKALKNEVFNLEQLKKVSSEQEQMRINRQISAYEKIAESISKIGVIEQARIDFQEVFTGIGAINSTVGSLKDFGGIFDKLNDGGMDFLDTLEAIGNNPDLIAAIDLTNDGFELSKTKIKEIAEAKKAETIDFLKNEKTKLEVVSLLIGQQLGSTKDISDAEVEKAEIALAGYASEGEGLNQLFDAEVQLTQTQLDGIATVGVAQYNAHKERMGYINKEGEAYASAYGTDYKTIDPMEKVDSKKLNFKEQQLDFKSSNGKLTQSDISQILAQKFGISTKNKSNKAILEEAKVLIDQSITTYDQLISKLESTPIKGLLNKAGGKDGSDQIKDLNDSLEKFYNILRKIEDLESDLTSLQSRIDLQKTGSKEDLKLLEQKGQIIASLIKSQEYLNEQREIELKKMRTQIEAYNGFVYIQGKSMAIAQEQLSLQLLNGKITQEFYDSVVEFADGYNQMANSIEEAEQAVYDLQKQQEEMYDEIVNRAIEIRQQLHDVILAADQKELEELEKKYSKMTEMENEYLSAVKNAITQQREARTAAAEEEDLISKKRRLATLDRDTSGLYATQASELQREIATSEQKKKDEIVDSQLAALEKQIQIQQEQRDLQMAMLQEQQLAREETGYYWDRVDAAIQQGPAAMIDLLSSSQEYQKSDPLVQKQQIEEMRQNAEYLATMAEGNSQNVVDNIQDNARQIVDKIGSIVDAINGIDIKVNVSSGGSSSGSTGGTTGVTTGGTAPSQKTIDNQGTSDSNIKTLQTFLKSKGLYSGAIDGWAGVATDSAMASLWTKALKQASYEENGAAYSALLDGKNNKDITASARQYIIKMLGTGYSGLPTIRYKQGGYVSHTGPAWVDGTPSKPEAFLDSADTKLIGGLRDFLRSSFGTNNLNPAAASNSSSVSIGDINISLQNPTNASPEEIARLVKKEITGSFNNRVSMTIQKVR